MEIAALQAGLQSPQLSPIEAEYQRTKRLPGHFPEWFSLFDGPKGRKALADVVRYGAMHRLVYGPVAVVSHRFWRQHFSGADDSRGLRRLAFRIRCV